MDLLIFLHCVCDNWELVIRSQLTTKERSVEYDIRTENLKKDYYSLETKILSTRSETAEGPKIWGGAQLIDHLFLLFLFSIPAKSGELKPPCPRFRRPCR